MIVHNASEKLIIDSAGATVKVEFSSDTCATNMRTFCCGWFYRAVFLLLFLKLNSDDFLFYHRKLKFMYLRQRFILKA